MINGVVSTGDQSPHMYSSAVNKSRYQCGTVVCIVEGGVCFDHGRFRVSAGEPRCSRQVNRVIPVIHKGIRGVVV